MTDRTKTGQQPANEFKISFEVFPPASEAGAEKLLRVAKDLEPFDPAFFSVTYGAGGSSRERTLKALSQIGATTSHNLAGHLTCVAASKAETNSVALRYLEKGIRRIVALRGDARSEDGVYRPHPEGYVNAADLVAGLRKLADFDISVAAYPEAHPESASRKADIDNLKAKFDAGANRGITQFFFDNHLFEDFLDATQRSGICAPIVPGIILIHDFEKVRRFAGMCQADVPAWLAERFAGVDPKSDDHVKIAADIAAEQVLGLKALGISAFHFYTMNRSDLALRVCKNLGAETSAGLSCVA